MTTTQTVQTGKALARRLDSIRCEVAYCRTALVVVGKDYPEERGLVSRLNALLAEVSAALVDRCVDADPGYGLSGEERAMERLMEDLS